MKDSVAPAWCNEYRKIPYVSCGRTREGLDCYGIVVLVNRERFGRIVPDYQYKNSVDQDEIAPLIVKNLPLDWVQVTTPQEGDLIMFQIAQRPWHCGIWVADNLMLHAIDGFASGIDRLDSLRWHRRLMGYYRPMSAS